MTILLGPIGNAELVLNGAQQAGFFLGGYEVNDVSGNDVQRRPDLFRRGRVHRQSTSISQFDCCSGLVAYLDHVG